MNAGIDAIITILTHLAYCNARNVIITAILFFNAAPYMPVTPHLAHSAAASSLSRADAPRHVDRIARAVDIRNINDNA